MSPQELEIMRTFWTMDWWTDPNPAPVLEEHDGFVVVRDDLLPAGSKIRFADALVRMNPHINEWVYGSAPRWGFGPVSAAFVCQKYGVKFTCFLAESKAKHPNYYKMLDYGANIIEVPVGFLAVTEAKARDYAADDFMNRRVLPIGLEHPSVLASIVKVAIALPTPKRFWTTGSSGTLNRGLQYAWPDAEAHVLSVGHKMSRREIGRAILHTTPLKFPQHPKKQDLPPFPCVPEYEGKLWKLMKEEAQPGDLFWNVAGN
jgi:hypothetical protein